MANYSVLFCSGDSYTYGEELNDRSYSYPHILGKRLGVDSVINKGICSASNDYIFRTTCDYVIRGVSDGRTVFDDVIVVLGWTSTIRWEAYLGDYNRYVQLKTGRSMRFVNTEETRILKEDEMTKIMSPNRLSVYNSIAEDYSNIFRRHLLYNLYYKLNLMYATHRMLESHRIRHLFFNSLYENSEFKMKRGKNNEDILAKIRNLSETMVNDGIYIADTTMDRYCSKYPKGDIEGHPLEEGHSAWAEYLYEKISSA